MLDKALFCAIITVLGGGVDALAARAIPKMEFGMQDNDTKIGEIYRAHCRPTGKSYIGQTWDLATRKRMHLSGKGRCPAFNAAIKKHGADKFEWSIIGRATTQEGLDALERAAIAAWRTLAPGGYNLREGGEGGRMSAETRAKLAQASSGRKHSTESKMKISALRRGKKLSAQCREKIRTSMKKREMSPEHIAKIAAANRRRVFTDEDRAKIAAVHRGKTVSAQTRAKLSASGKIAQNRPEVKEKQRSSHLGKKQNPEAVAKTAAANRGRKHTQQARKNMSAGCKRRLPPSAATRAKISLGNKGKKCPYLAEINRKRAEASRERLAGKAGVGRII